MTNVVELSAMGVSGTSIVAESSGEPVGAAVTISSGVSVAEGVAEGVLDADNSQPGA